jgi:cyclomaltodextrinase / maltogenic alpha-amylase / neopullulanase
MKRLLFLITIIYLGTATIYCQKNTPLNKQQARTAPQWITEGIIYQIQLRTFTAEGTLNAATKRLPHVADLGATIVYLCPVFVADDGADTTFWSTRQKASGLNNPRNPYRIKDYFHIDPEYGTENDLQRFVDEAHKYGIRVMLDVVYRHCGPNAVFLKDHPDFVKREDNGKFITNRYNWPLINYDNPELREYLCKNMAYLIEKFDIDGFRFDSVLGIHYDIPLDFLEFVRERMEKIRPDVGMLAESRGRPEDQLKAIDINYPSERFFNWNNIEKVKANWKKLRNENPIGGARFIRFIENHDIAHNAGTNRIEKAWGFNKINVALVTIFTFDGVPFIYNGQEIADAACHNIFGPGYPIDWKNAEELSGQLRFTFIKKLCELRKTENALTHGKLEWINNDQPEAVLSYLREFDGEQILTIVNLSNQPQRVQPEKIIGGNTEPFKSVIEKIINGDIHTGLELPEYGFWIGKRKLH